MNNKEVQELLTQFDESSIKEFDLRKGEFRLYMNKNHQATRNNEFVSEKIEMEPVMQHVPIIVSEDEPSNPPIAKSEVDTESVLSPIVGVVYLQPSPDKPTFKQQGDTVQKGEVICIIEAMKLMNEITAPVDGLIEEILVKNEEVVEFNQPLFRINKGAKI